MTTGSPPSSSDSKSSSVFDQLHEGVRRWIWDQNWTELRPVQERAAAHILKGDVDVIISAPTAGGKTEAAFLPIASRMADADRQSIACLCISPLKALINDQADRLTPLFERVELPLTPWHGDVPQGRKNRLLKNPQGALLITPESLEAMFVLRGAKLPVLFSGLQYVVIDELHSFIGTERGRQMQSLLNRLELALRRRIPRIALSATLGDMTLAAEALRIGHGSDVALVEADNDGREFQMQLRGYRAHPPKIGREEDAPQSEQQASPLVRDLFDALRGRDNLAFANSRMKVEHFTDQLRRLSEKERLPNEFYAHHGNLSKEIREEAERRVKDRTKPTTVVCTSTLELGIDIGSVSSVAQVGPPPSVASLRQRLGRSGRKDDDPAVLRLYITEEDLGKTSTLEDELRVQTVQAIAVVQLLLSRWCEPPAPRQLHLSTLVQQILSVIAQHGGVSARDLFRVLCVTGPFRGIESGIFAKMLRCLGDGNILIQTSDGGLTLGDRGEKLVEHYTFYVAFTTPDEFRLVHGSKTLGTMPINNPLSPGGHLIFAGRRWEVVHVDETSRIIEVRPARGGRPPRFDGGGFDVHDRIREEMFQIYSSSSFPMYLDATARDLVREARETFERWRLATNGIIEAGGSIRLFPWRGDRVLGTLALQFTALQIPASVEGLSIVLEATDKGRVVSALERIAERKVATGGLLAKLAQNRIEEKYDWALTSELLCENYASRHLDEAGARNAAADLLQGARSTSDD